MFKAQPVKRKNEDIKLDDDDLLGSIMEDIHNDSASMLSTPKPMVLHKKPKRSLNSNTPRFSHNPFAIKNSSSVERDCLSNTAHTSSKLSTATNFPRKVLHPKVVDFDNAAEIDDPTPIFKEEIKKIDVHHPPDVQSEPEKCANHDVEDDMDFGDDLSSDLFSFAENSMDCEKVVATEPLSQINSNADLFESHFQGNFNNSDKGPQNEVVSEVFVDPGHLPLITLENGESVLRFFWFDAFEDQYKNPGVVYLFGKLFLTASNSYVSVCVIVKDIQRRVYILPRETVFNIQTKRDVGTPVTMQDVYTEISSVASKMKITEFKTKKTTKNYSFDNVDIPDKCEYLEVQYSARFPPFPSNLSGSTFSHVLGTDTSSLEILLMDRKLKGPGWVDIHFPQISNPPVSWCKIEAIVSKIQHVVPVTEMLSLPTLVVLSLRLTTVVNLKTQQNEIVAISCLSNNQFPLDKAAPKPHFDAHFCALTKPNDCIFPYDFKDVVSKCKNIKIERFDSERALLAYFLAKLHKTDPDVIVGHDIVGFDLDVLLHRITSHKIPNWSRVGRLKRAGAPRLNNATHTGASERNATCGRLLCDIKISAKELLRCKSYDLVELANQILDRKYEEIPSENVRSYYSSSTQLLQLVDNAMMSTDFILSINCELNILPLALQITNIAGCVMSRTLLGGRSERNEYLLLHAFHEKNYIYPSKFYGKKPLKNANNDEEDLETPNRKQGRRKPAYEGGLVLEPKKGFYDKFILLMDFNSLYPSIIQEYNICFTTIDRVPHEEKSNKEEFEITLPDPGTEPGVLPTEIRKLVQSRKQVKQMMKTVGLPKDQLVQYDIRQKALKLTANSMYGCLGFTHSRFYAKPLAALITRKGREILMKTKELVEKMGLDVIYGDTDSIMINTNQIDFDDVLQLGHRVKAEINKLYRLLEIDIDGMYKPMLLLKKKKYAALAVSRQPNGQLITKEEMKGLDIVRRDWSQLAKTAGEFVINQILSTKPKEEILENIHSYLISLGEDIRSEKKPLSDFVIVKQLAKNPEDYPDKKSLPHVLVAMRMNTKLGKKLRQHDTVPYVICSDGSDLPNTQRAYHLDELKGNDKLKIDQEYYLSNQVHPVISRLCNPIEGTDAAMIATLLGLNPSKYASSTRCEEQEEDKFLRATSVFDDEDRFKRCDKLTFQCPKDQCGENIVLDNIFKTEVSPLSFQLSCCPNTKCNANMIDHRAALCNQLQKTIRKYITRYYKRVLVCEDEVCTHRTRKMPLIFSSGGPVCPACKKANLHPEYTEAELYLQLAYFSHLFDINKAKRLLPNDEKDKLQFKNNEDSLYSHLKYTVDQTLQKSSYGEVNLSVLFQGLFPRSQTL